LIGLKDLYKKADTDFIIAHQVQQSQTCSVSQRPKKHFHIEGFDLPHATADISTQK
jgi:hypothetical protein